MNSLRNALLVPAFATTVAACGSGDHENMSMSTTAASTPTAASPATSTPRAAEFNEADVTFAQGMIPHHDQAIEMANIALDPAVGASEPIKQLAARIKDAQAPEIQLMTGWLTSWGQPVQMPTEQSDDMSSMDGTMTDEQITQLAASSGPAFNTMWQQMMILHHEGAIGMAQDEIDAGTNTEAIALANDIVEAQQAEIDEMQMALAG